METKWQMAVNGDLIIACDSSKGDIMPGQNSSEHIMTADVLVDKKWQVTNKGDTT